MQRSLKTPYERYIRIECFLSEIFRKMKNLFEPFTIFGFIENLSVVRMIPRKAKKIGTERRSEKRGKSRRAVA